MTSSRTKASLRSGPSVVELQTGFGKGGVSTINMQQNVDAEELLWMIDFDAMAAKPKAGGELKDLRRVPPPLERFMAAFSETAFWSYGDLDGSNSTRNDGGGGGGYVGGSSTCRGMSAKWATMSKKVPVHRNSGIGSPSTAGSGNTFVALGARDVLLWARGEFKRLRDLPKGSGGHAGWNAARKLATAKASVGVAMEISRLFIVVQTRLAKNHIPMLQKVVATQGSKHLVSFRQTLDGIRREPNFRRYCDLAQTASESVASRHSSELLQQKHCSQGGLFLAAESVHARYGHFMKTLAQATGGEHLAVDMKGEVRVLEKTGR